MQHRLLFTLIFCNVDGIQLKFWRDVNRIENKKMKNWEKMEMENMDTSLLRGHCQGEKMDAFQYIFFSGPISKSSMLTPFFYTNHFIGLFIFLLLAEYKLEKQWLRKWPPIYSSVFFPVIWASH